MANYSNIETLTVTAGAAVRLYRFVQLQADGKFDEVGSAQARADGVCAEAAAADEDVFAMAELRGKMKLEAGAAVTRGALVASDDEGRAIDSVDAGGNYAMGVALEAATGAGEIIEVLLHSPIERDA